MVRKWVGLDTRRNHINTNTQTCLQLVRLEWSQGEWEGVTGMPAEASAMGHPSLLPHHVPGTLHTGLLCAPFRIPSPTGLSSV